MINVERLANVIENAAFHAEHSDQEYPMKAEAEAAYIDVLDQLIEQLTETDSITETMCRNYMVDWLKAVRGQK